MRCNLSQCSDHPCLSFPQIVLEQRQTAIETQLKNIPWPLGSEFDIDRICKKYMTFVLRWETKIDNRHNMGEEEALNRIKKGRAIKTPPSQPPQTPVPLKKREGASSFLMDGNSQERVKVAIFVVFQDRALCESRNGWWWRCWAEETMLVNFCPMNFKAANLIRIVVIVVFE